MQTRYQDSQGKFSIQCYLVLEQPRRCSHRFNPHLNTEDFLKYCFKSRLAEAIERAIDPYIGIKHDRDDDELDDNDEIRSIGVFVNDSESFIKYISRGLFDGCLKLA